MSIWADRLEQSLRNPALVPLLASKSDWNEMGCLVWGDTKGSKGYGKYNSIEVHILAFIAQYGPVPKGMVLAHPCHNKLCIVHARPTTQGDNVRESATLITHCPYGHEYTIENTTYNSRGGRHCRMCNNHNWDKRTWKRVKEVVR